MIGLDRGRLSVRLPVTPRGVDFALGGHMVGESGRGHAERPEHPVLHELLIGLLGLPLDMQAMTTTGPPL